MAEDAPPLRDPYDRPPPRRSSWAWAVPVTFLILTAGFLTLFFVVSAKFSPPPPSVIGVKATPNVFVAVRDLARLETEEVHVEKVIDLTDTQSRMFGLIEGTDAILLVATGTATLGVDLSKLAESDVSLSPDGKAVELRLPAPELLNAGLDEKATYVYTRTTSLLARRNEQLESKARLEAVESIKKVATSPDMIARAKAQAERQLKSLITRLGPERVDIVWKE